MKNIPEQQKILSLPFTGLLNEGRSQRDRIAMEVMEQLFNLLPEKLGKKADFVLLDGTKCRIKKFSAPKITDEGETKYGFDVVLENHALAHLEFSVRCSGWERSMK